LIVLASGFFLYTGCAPASPQAVKGSDRQVQVKSRDQAKSEDQAAEDGFLQETPKPVKGDQRKEKVADSQRGLSNQELLDSALELLQASNDYWEQGDLDNALDALDKAYSLILQVEEEEDPDMMQQREDLRITIAKRIVEVYASRFTVADGTHKVIPLVMNDHVKKEIDSFLGREKEFFLAAYCRSGKYRPTILKMLKDEGLPKELSWLPLIESGYKVRAFSRARALGLWQFIASTGYKYGLKRDTWIDERMDPEKSTRAAIAYLKDLHQMFGDWTTALAAYNCGEWAVLKRIRTQPINYLDHFWDLYEKLPRETAAYVPRLIAVLHLTNNPEKYGLVLPPTEEEVEYEEVMINKKVSLKTIASRLSVECDLLQELNAELRQDMTPNSPYPLKVPAGNGKVLLAKLSDIPESDIPAWRPYSTSRPFVLHTVKRGESLASLARKYKTSVRAIKDMNGLGKKDKVNVGWTIKVPTRKGAVPVVAARSPEVAVIEKLPNAIEYVVKPGDTLWKISASYNTTPKELRALNNLTTPNLMNGQVLMILPGPGTIKAVKTRSYKIRPGDTMYNIARRHDMELSEFLKMNNLSPKKVLKPGQVVQVIEH
jgi:membrane-bound lytic murein transglycosylase D